MSPQAPVKLAIVDDPRLFRQGLGYILRRAGYEVVQEAASGRELFDGLEAHQPNVVLLDLHMQEMDGKEVSRRLLAHHPHVRIIILSMDYSPDFILDLMRLGVHGYLPKDIDQRILAEAIEQVYTQGCYINDTVAQVMRNGLQGKLKATVHKVADDHLMTSLTEREKEVLALLCKGYSSSKIADMLFISFRTVEGHRKHLLEKTGTSNAVGLAVFALKHQLIA